MCAAELGFIDLPLAMVPRVRQLEIWRWIADVSGILLPHEVTSSDLPCLGHDVKIDWVDCIDERSRLEEEFFQVCLQSRRANPYLAIG